MLAKVGIKVKLKLVEVTVLTEIVIKGDTRPTSART